MRSRAFLVDDLDDISRAGKPYEAKPDDVAFIQFSSGSTSEPKGVVLTHSNVIANCSGVSQAAKLTEDDISLSWMPLTHDMGLIGFHIIMFSKRRACAPDADRAVRAAAAVVAHAGLEGARDHPVLA